MCNIIVPLRPKTIKKDLDEKIFVDWHCDVNRFNSNFCGWYPNKYMYLFLEC